MELLGKEDFLARGDERQAESGWCGGQPENPTAKIYMRLENGQTFARPHAATRTRSTKGNLGFLNLKANTVENVSNSVRVQNQAAMVGEGHIVGKSQFTARTNVVSSTLIAW